MARYLGPPTDQADAPVDDYRLFIDEFTERVREMAEVLRYATGTLKVVWWCWR